MNANFKAAAQAVKTINSKNGSMWSSLVLFATDLNTPDVDVVKEQFKANEKEANAEFRMKIGENSTYRVIKGVISDAIRYGVALLDDKGKPRGKTQVEEDIKSHKAEKPTIDKFKSTMSTATALADKLLVETEVATAQALVTELWTKLDDALKLMRSSVVAKAA